jgi:hypothetical protein
VWTPAKLSPLDAFAADFIADIDHYGDVRSEALAAALRARFHLPPFPQIDDLRRLCQALGIPLWTLPDGLPELRGVNVSYGDRVYIALQRTLRVQQQESTIAHEIREALENAFRRVKPSYEGRHTHDNMAMNPASDRFTGYLLMETEASRALIREVGFDFAQFSRCTGRPLSAVVVRLQQLFPAPSLPAPVIGTWLFEAEWPLVEGYRATPEDLTARYTAKLSGFTQRKGTLTAAVFPKPRARLVDFPSLHEAMRRREPCSVTVAGMGLNADMDYLVLAEPIAPWDVPWRVLVTAVRVDGVVEVAPLLARLRPHDFGQFQQRL